MNKKIQKFSAIYFLKTAKILKHDKMKNITKVQFFQRDNNVVLCGIKHSIEIIKKYIKKYKQLKIYALSDGDHINKNDVVLTIEGRLWNFVHLEGIIDGILTRESSIATNASKIINSANKKPIIYMNDRSDYYFTQFWDAYAAHKGGVTNFVTQAQVKLIKDQNVKVIGTMPHILIQNYKGQLDQALSAYDKYINENKLVALIDYNNDVIGDLKKILPKFKDKLTAIRIDTPKNLIDKSLLNSKKPKAELYGVNIHLVKLVKDFLVKQDCSNVKIIISSGLNCKKIEYFEKHSALVDIYGVGKSFSNINLNFTCDAVLLNNKKESKFGRGINPNSKLKKVN